MRRRRASRTPPRCVAAAGLSPAVTSSCPATSVPTPDSAIRVGLIAVTSGPIRASSSSISTESCWWRRASARSASIVATVGSSAAVRSGRRVRAVRDQLAVAEPAQRGCAAASGAVTISDLIWRWASARAATARAAGHPQRAQRVDLPAAGLRDTGGPAGLGSPGGGLGVDRVGLTLPAAGLAVRAVDLDQLDPCRLQDCGQPGPVGPGALNPDPHQLPEACAARPAARVAGRGGRELPVPQQPAGRVERGGGVGVFVRVDPTGDLDVGLLARWSAVSSWACRLAYRSGAGRHAPAGRTDKTVTGTCWHRLL